MSWEHLPEVILGKVYGHLGLLDKLKIKDVCQNWRRAESRPEIWHSFNYKDDYVWDKPMNGNAVADLAKFIKIKSDILECIHKYGQLFKDVNVYLKNEDSVDIFIAITMSCCNVNKFSLNKWWNCQLNVTFQRSLQSFLQNNSNLSEISFEDINLRPGSTNDPLSIGINHARKLEKLTLVNSFPSFSLSSLMYLVKLKELTINPHNLHFSLVSHLVSSSLTRLNIVANRKTKQFYFENLSEEHWREISQKKTLRVSIYMSLSDDWSEKKVLLKENMPLATLVYRKNLCLRLDHHVRTLPNYSDTLEEFVDYTSREGLFQHVSKEKTDPERQDKIIGIVVACPKLTTFAVKEILSSSSILFLVTLNPNMRNLYLREDLVIYTFDISEERQKLVPMKSLDFIRAHSSMENFQKGMCDILNKPWSLMSEKEHIDTLEAKYSLFL